MIESQELSSFSFLCGDIDPAIALASTPGVRYASIPVGVNTELTWFRRNGAGISFKLQACLADRYGLRWVFGDVARPE
jgi:hypothetical protein